MRSPGSGIRRREARPVAVPIERLAGIGSSVQGVRRRDLVRGERIVISTRNSIYALSVRDDGTFEVSGGWFEREGESPTITAIAGCSAGGHALFTELVAAPGFFIEFGDGIRTTRVRTIRRIAGTGASR